MVYSVEPALEVLKNELVWLKRKWGGAMGMQSIRTHSVGVFHHQSRSSLRQGEGIAFIPSNAYCRCHAYYWTQLPTEQRSNISSSQPMSSSPTSQGELLSFTQELPSQIMLEDH